MNQNGYVGDFAGGLWLLSISLRKNFIIYKKKKLVNWK